LIRILSGVRRKRWPIVLACIVLAVLIASPGAAYFWIRWDHEWLKPDATATVIAVRFHDVDDQSLRFHVVCSSAFLAAGSTPAFGHVVSKRGSRAWPRKYVWERVLIPWKSIAEMERLLPEYKVSLDWELADTGEHVSYRIAVVDPSGAVVYAP